MGLYCNISIVLFYVFFYIVYLMNSNQKRKKEFQLFSLRRYIRYGKIIFSKKVIKIIIIFSIISNTITLYQNNQYKNLYQNLDNQNCELVGMVVSIEEERYKVKIENQPYQKTYIYLYFNENLDIAYGDQIIFKGVFASPQKRSNYKGFDYANYLKTKKIYGTVKAESVKIMAKNKGNQMITYANKLKEKLKERIERINLSQEEKAMLKGILLGDITEISEDTISDFSKSSILHILSVSGMHISYIIIVSGFIFEKGFGKHFSKLITSMIIFIYMAILNFTPSVARAGICGIIFTLSNFFYRKNDVWESLAVALFAILLYNPFLLQDIGLELSFAGTIGIIIFQKTFQKWINDLLDRKKRKAIRRNQKLTKWMIKNLQSQIGKSILDAIFVTISANLILMPILLITFHTISLTSLLVSILTSFIVGPIMILGLIVMMIRISFLETILHIFLKLLINMAKWGSHLPFNQIYLITPSIFTIIIFYSFLFLLNEMITIKLEKNPSMFQKRIKNLIYVAKYKWKSHKKKGIIVILIICFIFHFISLVPKNLKIYFIDVGQGDCSLIITPRNQSILIDGGGSEWSDFDVRRKNIDAIFIK